MEAAQNLWQSARQSSEKHLGWITCEETFKLSHAPEDGTDSCPETSVRNYHYSQRNGPEEGSSTSR